MENSKSIETSSKSTSWLLISGIIALIFAAFIWFYLFDKKEVASVEDKITETLTEIKPILPVQVIPEIEVDETVFEEPPVVEPPVVAVIEQTYLPSLDDSDSWLKEKLPSLTWRNELLKLVIDDRMIRHFVVFIDNFSRGIVAYKYSPLVLPSSSFSAIETQVFDDENQQEWLWDTNSEKRFSLYIDLLKSMDSQKLIAIYLDIKPLFDEAFAELGYPDNDFTETLQRAITRILDAQLPKSPLTIIRPSVMYKYKDADVEALDDVDKLLLRLGKENLLIIKSALLEFSEILSQETLLQEQK